MRTTHWCGVYVCSTHYCASKNRYNTASQVSHYVIDTCARQNRTSGKTVYANGETVLLARCCNSMIII